MKMLLVLAVLVGVVAARPQFELPLAVTAVPTSTDPGLLFKSDVRDEWGQYSYTIVTVGGVTMMERGYFTPTLDGGRAFVKEGKTSYPSPDGRIITETYTAGLDGTHVVGDHIPKQVVPLL